MMPNIAWVSSKMRELGPFTRSKDYSQDLSCWLLGAPSERRDSPDGEYITRSEFITFVYK